MTETEGTDGVVSLHFNDQLSRRARRTMEEELTSYISLP